MEADTLSFKEYMSGRRTRLHSGNTELANAERTTAQSINPTGIQEVFDINPLLQRVSDWESTENLSLD